MEIAISIHDIWLMEEKAISLRSFVTLRPPIAPTIEEKRDAKMIKNTKSEDKFKYEIRNIGAIFWIVIRIKAWGQVRPSITWGNQKCKGAAPNFKRSENVIKVREKGSEYINIDADIMIIVEARA